MLAKLKNVFVNIYCVFIFDKNRKKNFRKKYKIKNFKSNIYYLSKYISLIECYCSEVIFDSLNIFKSSTAYILSVNHNLIFKFPFGLKITERYKRAKSATDLSRKFIEIEIPNIDIIKIKNYDEMGFLKYSMIMGDTYSKLSPSIKELVKNELCKDIAKFLYSMHSVNICRNDNIFIREKEMWIFASPVLNNRDLIIDMLKFYNQDYLFKNTLDSFLKIELDNSYDSLIHGDFHLENILFDRNTGRVVGVIDFDESDYDNFNKDFINFVYYPEMLKDIIREYEFLRKIKVNLDHILVFAKIRKYCEISYLCNENNITCRLEKHIQDLNFIENNYKI